MKHAIVLLTLLLWLGARPGVLGAEATVSPYSKWTHGPSADPAFFPIAVWLQSPANASRYRQAGRCLRKATRNSRSISGRQAMALAPASMSGT